MLKGKTVILGVTGGIAAYKAANLASLLVKQHADVHVIMTANARHFITPETFEALTKNRCLTDTFDRNHPWEVEHIALAEKADAMIIAPATADAAARLAHGIADDMLTTTALACTCPRILAPAMNTRMYENPVTQDNLNRLRNFGWTVVEPDEGILACGTSGKGRLPDEKLLLEYVLRAIAKEQDYAGKRVLVTAGPTQEAIDPVRFITNHSSGKMGYAVARMAMLRGADVTLVSGPCAIEPPHFVKFEPVTTAQELFEAVTARSADMDVIIKAAAVADYRPIHVRSEKIHKQDREEKQGQDAGKVQGQDAEKTLGLGTEKNHRQSEEAGREPATKKRYGQDGAALLLPLERTPDTLGYLGEHRREGQLLCGFAMETSDLEKRAREKLIRKHLDLIVANNVKVSGAGFGTDTNVATLITKESEEALPLISKEELAMRILDKLKELK